MEESQERDRLRQELDLEITATPVSVDLNAGPSRTTDTLPTRSDTWTYARSKRKMRQSRILLSGSAPDNTTPIALSADESEKTNRSTRQPRSIKVARREKQQIAKQMRRRIRTGDYPVTTAIRPFRNMPEGLDEETENDVPVRAGTDSTNARASVIYSQELFAAAENIVDQGRGKFLRTYINDYKDDRYDSLRFDNKEYTFILGMCVAELFIEREHQSSILNWTEELKARRQHNREMPYRKASFQDIFPEL